MAIMALFSITGAEYHLSLLFLVNLLEFRLELRLGCVRVRILAGFRVRIRVSARVRDELAWGQDDWR